MKNILFSKKISRGVSVACGLMFFVAAVWVGLSYKIPHADSAAAPQNITGWAWSSTLAANSGGNREGWISLNCQSDPGGCTASNGNYGLKLNNNDNYIVGYAWNPSVGWVKFGGLSGFPSGTGTTADNAKIVGNNIVGWARACIGGASGTCTDTSGTSSNGWDGWISLGGTSTTGFAYGISAPPGPQANDPTTGADYSTNATAGWAWGNSVAGWIMFKPSMPGGNCTVGTTCINNGDGTFSSQYTDQYCRVIETSCGSGACPAIYSLPFFCNPATASTAWLNTTNAAASGPVTTRVRKGATITLYWSVSSLSDGSGCTVYGTNGDTYGAAIFGGATSGNYTFTPIPASASYTKVVYALTCTVGSSNGNPVTTNTVVITLPPTFKEI